MGPAFSFCFVLPLVERPLLTRSDPLAFPGFVHNFPTRLQQGGFASSMVSFPYFLAKTAYRPSQVLFLFFCSFAPHLSLTEKGLLSSEPVLFPFPEFVHKKVTQAQRGLSGALLGASPTSPKKLSHRAELV